ncbi:hypothetical protein MN608_01713 [Microdochium nivale]|nr:hypothetical protein MN608_01713 [Microdochium nivale]
MPPLVITVKRLTRAEAEADLATTSAAPPLLPVQSSSSSTPSPPPPLQEVRYRLRRPGAAPGSTRTLPTQPRFPPPPPPLPRPHISTQIIIPDDSKCWTFKLVHSCGHAASRSDGGGGGGHERQAATIQVKRGEHWGPCCALLRGCDRKWGRLELGRCDMCELLDSGCELIPL